MKLNQCSFLLYFTLNQRKLLLAISLFSATQCFSQSMSISATGTAASSSAGLDIDFTNKGFLIPRVSLLSTGDVATIASPATSLVVYNTNAGMTSGSIGFWYWNGAAWTKIITGPGTAWTFNGNVLTGTLPATPTEFIGSINVSDWIIRTNNAERMRITSTGAILATGDITTGVTPTSGAGTRMMWIPAKGAFRAGIVTGTQWDDANIGNYSFAANHNNIAKGLASDAFGSGNTVNADYGAAFGLNNTIAAAATAGFASGSTNTVNALYGAALGYNNTIAAGATAGFAAGSTNTVSSLYGIALGYSNNIVSSATAGFASGSNNTVSSLYGIAMGYGHTIAAAATAGVALGYQNTVASTYGVCMGYNNTIGAVASAGFAAGSTNAVNSNYGISLGYGNTVGSSAIAGFAEGYGNTVNANYGTAMGYNNSVSGIAGVALGKNITVSGDNSFCINLASASAVTLSQANTMAIMNGKVGIETLAPSSTLHVGGSISLKRIATAANYTILSGDFYIGVTSTAAARTITLPSAASVGPGKIYMIQDESGGAATNNITISAAGGDQIDGSATKAINTNYGYRELVSDGVTNWFIWDQ